MRDETMVEFLEKRSILTFPSGFLFRTDPQTFGAPLAADGFSL